jgi:hypothetical protein
MDITQILTLNYPEAQWVLDGNDYAGLTWLSDTPKPTKAALEKQWADVQYKIALEKNDEARRNAYQTESDPLFFQWQRGEATEQAWKDKIAEIQALYPEPTKPAN